MAFKEFKRGRALKMKNKNEMDKYIVTEKSQTRGFKFEKFHMYFLQYSPYVFQENAAEQVYAALRAGHNPPSGLIRADWGPLRADSGLIQP